MSVDGYRLAMRTEMINLKFEEEDEIRFVVPGKTLSEVIKLLPDQDENVEILVGRRHIIFKIEKYSVISRLLEGEFLDYKAAIPAQFTTEVTVNTRNLINSVERVSLLITDRLKSPVRCIFSEVRDPVPGGIRSPRLSLVSILPDRNIRLVSDDLGINLKFEEEDEIRFVCRARGELPDRFWWAYQDRRFPAEAEAPCSILRTGSSAWCLWMATGWPCGRK